ncbi:MAG: ABC transporter ATP-binding protein/permease [Candidatus Riflebacteria bacterium]|nr:ABC transporter ATP-binding protein/permease [Candidatus Riflebacteria bacterium]
MTKKNDNKSVFKRLLPYFGPHLVKLGISMLTMIVVTAVHLIRPMILRNIIDTAIPQKDIGMALKLAGFFILCLLFGALALYIRVKIMARIGAEVVAEIKRKLFSHILGQGMRFFDQNQSGKLITRTESDSNQIKSLFTQSSAQLFASAMLVLGTVIVLFYEDLKVGTFAIISMLVVSLLLFFYLSYIRTMYTKVREKGSQLTGYLTEYIQGVPLIKVHGREADIMANMNKYGQEKATLECKAAFIEYSLFSTSFRFCTEIGSIMVLFAYCSSRVFDGTMTVGTLVMFIELLRQFFRPLESLVEVLAQMQTALAAGVRVFDILDTEPAVKDIGEPSAELRLEKSIEFEDVSFAYDTEIVLKNASFSIPRGQQLAIVGASGSGKTTCINLLLRFYDPTSGRITVDGRDISSIKLLDWRRKIALVLQEIYLFPGTIMENLKAFHTDVADETVIKAAQELGAHDFILKQPQGYQTVLAERGANLSYGERQLLSYTRAMVKNPDLLILDEATSSVDVITERELQTSMEKLMSGRTGIVIAHRLSTIRKADRILVFEKGLLIQSGNHETLLQQQGIYRELVEIQTGSDILGEFSEIEENDEEKGAVA